MGSDRDNTADAGRDARAFDAAAVAYDLLIDEEKRWARERDLLLRWLHEAGEGKMRVLDLGCGPGFHASHLAGYADADATGADPSGAMLEVARSKPFGDRVRWVEATAELPPSGPFDLVLLLGNTISLINQPRVVFEAASASTVPGGILAIQTLDYGKLREAGVSRRERHGRGYTIVKTLTPHGRESQLAATVELRIHDDKTGREVSRQEEELIDHPSEELVRQASACGWSLDECRASWDDSLPGTDRIFVFRREK